MIRLESRPYRDKKIQELKLAVAQIRPLLGRAPKLRVIVVGTHPPSALYVANKKKLALEVGIDAETIAFQESINPNKVAERIAEMNADPSIDGILIQRPLPLSFNEKDVLYWVSPEKDVDAFHPETVGKLVLGLPGFLPCTPAGCLKLLDFYGYSLAGKISCVIGRSSIVGKPLAQLLLQKNATVFHCHSQTKDLEMISQQADFVFVAVGKPGFIGAKHIKPGAVVIDIGISKDPSGKTVGDVAYDAVSEIVSAITPVPGGIGPMTILGLLENTLESAKLKC